MIQYINEIPKIDDYWDLFLSTGWNSIFNMDAQTIESAISNSSFAVSAYSSGQLIGFARAVSDKVMYATIYDVIVLRDYKNRGGGSELVANITKQCKEAGVFSLHLFAAEGTEVFYNKAGYQTRPSNMPDMRFEPKNSS